jgi:hypothetical protein
MAINWKDSPSTPDSIGKANPWFAITVGLLGLIVGYIFASFYA